MQRKHSHFLSVKLTQLFFFFKIILKSGKGAIRLVKILLESNLTTHIEPSNPMSGTIS